MSSPAPASTSAPLVRPPVWEYLKQALLNSPRCEHIVRATGLRCKCPARTGQRFCRSHIEKHLTRAEYMVVLQVALERHRRRLHWAGFRGDMARKHFAAVQRRILRLQWKDNPTIPGATIELSPDDRARVCAYLMEKVGVDLDGVWPETGRVLTPRTVDKLTWITTQLLSDRATQKQFDNQTAWNLRREKKFWASLEPRGD